MKNELIRLRSIYASENNSTLDGADFKIYRGEVLELVGGFHAGKRLLTEIIDGTHIPERGYRFIHGKPEDWVCPAQNLRVKHLKKNFGLIGQMTVWENIATYRRRKAPFSGFLMPERMRSKVQEMLYLYGLEADSRIMADRLTSIQKFAVALIKAKLEGVELILAENSELEYSVSGYRLMERILRLCREQGIAVMLYGIDTSGFLPLADRVCLIDGGRIIWEENVSESDGPRAFSSRGTMSFQLNIPLRQSPAAGETAPKIRVETRRFQIDGSGGQFFMLVDPEQSLSNVMPDPEIRAFFLQDPKKKAHVRQIDFSNFDRLVKWMSPSDNLIFGLPLKISRYGVIVPHLKQYLLQKFVEWSEEESYLHMKDCESLVIGERIKLAAFRLKMERPDVIIFRHFQLLDQNSRAIVQSVLSPLLEEGTFFIGLTALDYFCDFADGYFLVIDGACSERMDYHRIQAALLGNKEEK